MFDRNFSEESEETTEDLGLSPPETAATNRPRKDETRDQTTTDSPPLTYRLKPSKQLPTHPFIHLSYLIHSSTRIRQSTLYNYGFNVYPGTRSNDTRAAFSKHRQL